MRSYNDIDVYVEDSTYVGVYVTLVNKALGGRGAVRSVTALGPRDQVLRRAYGDTDLGGRPRIYIVDGDIDLVARLRNPSARHLYRLNVYSLENLVSERDGFEKIGRLSLPGLTHEDASKVVSFEEVQDELNGLLTYLYTVIGVAKRLKVRTHLVRNDSYGISRVVQGRVVSVDRNLCRRRIATIVAEIIRQKGRNRYKSARATVMQRLSARALEGFHIVPAKEFHLKYLVGRIGERGGLCLPQRAVVASLAESCTFANDPRLLRRLRRAVNHSPSPAAGD